MLNARLTAWPGLNLMVGKVIFLSLMESSDLNKCLSRYFWLCFSLTKLHREITNSCYLMFSRGSSRSVQKLLTHNLSIKLHPSRCSELLPVRSNYHDFSFNTFQQNSIIRIDLFWSLQDVFFVISIYAIKVFLCDLNQSWFD